LGANGNHLEILKEINSNIIRQNELLLEQNKLLKNLNHNIIENQEILESLQILITKHILSKDE